MNFNFKNLFIFEVANNHQGSVDHGVEIIRKMGELSKRHNIRGAVKLQYRNLDTFIHPDYKNDTKKRHISRFLQTRLTHNEYKRMVQETKNHDLVSVITPFDEESVDTAVKHKTEVLKVASCSATDWPLLEKIAETNLPVICSTGGLTVNEIDNLYSFFCHRNVDFALMHCVALYPTPLDKLNLNFLKKMKKRYPGLPIGYSGHEAPEELDPVKVAVSIGAEILERHVGVKTEKIQLNKYSMNPDETEKWILSALRAKSVCGEENKPDSSKEEKESLQSLKRGVFAGGNIKTGMDLKRNDVFFAMPCESGQLTSGEFGSKFNSYKATKKYTKNSPIYETSNPTHLHDIRNILHDMRGMLCEANIAIGKDFEIELSHHYGLGKFRDVGVLIVNVINREYCKKILVLLPGQKHPLHRHIKKEETFHVLSGTLLLKINDVEYSLSAGEKIVVERGAWHDFTTDNGVIIEEISTTHIIGDSQYKDERIAKLDPIERKTIIDKW